MPRAPKPKTSLSKGRPMADGQSKSALAAEIGVSRQCLNAYLEEGAPPGPAAAVRAWMKKHINPALSTRRDPPPATPAAAAEEPHEAPPPAEVDPLDLNVLRAAKIKQDTLKVRIANRRAMLEQRVREGELVSKEDVERTFSELIIEVRSQLERLPEQLRPRFPLAQQATLVLEVQNTVDFALRTLAGWRPSWLQETGGDDGEA